MLFLSHVVLQSGVVTECPLAIETLQTVYNMYNIARNLVGIKFGHLVTNVRFRNIGGYFLGGRLVDPPNH